MKQIKNVETGKVYRSVTAAAQDIGVSPGMIVHVLKGRQYSAGGFIWRYVDDELPKISRTVKYAYRNRRSKIIRDDSGNVYESIKALSIVKGIDSKRAYYLLNRDPEFIFRNEHLNSLPRYRFIFTAGFKVNGVAAGATKRDVQHYIYALAPNMSVQKLHNALDKVLFDGQKASVLYYGETGWTLENATHDLFAPLGRLKR